MSCSSSQISKLCDASYGWSGGCPQEALETGPDTVADCRLRLTHWAEDLAWSKTQKEKKRVTGSGKSNLSPSLRTKPRRTWTSLGLSFFPCVETFVLVCTLQSSLLRGVSSKITGHQTNFRELRHHYVCAFPAFCFCLLMAGEGAGEECCRKLT